MKDSSLCTDIAIEKIPKIEYKGLSQKENEALFRLARMVLMTSKLENDSNEVARKLYNDSINNLDKKSSKKEIYLAGLSFPARCSEVGLFYS